ncbi:arad-like aldolase/epimerase [Meredithblackwellia eburnea MCA 4105]
MVPVQAPVQPGAKSMQWYYPPTFDTKEAERKYKLERLAAAFRIFGKFGYEDGVAGHLTLRDPIHSDCFWVNPLGMAFSQICVSDLLLINSKGEVVAGGKPNRQIYNTAAFAVHHAIHSARPEANAACHAHSLYAKTFSAFGRPIDTFQQDCCYFYEDLAVYPSFGGVVLSGDEGEKIAEHMGSKKAIILQNHGILTVGETIDSAVVWFIFLERLCQAQLMLDAASAGRGEKPYLIGHEEALFTRATTGTEISGWNNAQMFFDIIEAETGGSYKN